MTKTRTWPVRAMYILIAATLVMSLIMTGAFTRMVSADPGLSEWDRVPTPTTEDYVLAPNSTIIDFAVGDDGEVAYVIIVDWIETSTRLLKSEDHAATWDDDIDDALTDELDEDGFTSWMLLKVACDADDSDFLAVAIWINDDSTVHVYVSSDGGATFRDTDEVEDGVFFPTSFAPADLAVSPEDDDERDIAIVGMDNNGKAVVFRCTVVGDFSTGWEDARYDGWDDMSPAPVDPTDFTSMFATWVEFAPSWDTDRTILVITVEPGTSDWAVKLQSGTWGTSEGWNADSVVSIDAVLIEDNVILPIQFTTTDARALAGLTLPLDYSGRNSDSRYVWVWVNYYDGTGDTQGTIYRVRNENVNPIGWQIADEDLWLTNVDYLGYISEGKAIAGVGGDGEDNLAVCCDGVDVYRNDNIVGMDICCYDWELACKPPTGRAGMAVTYVSDDPATSKAYAVALWCEFGYQYYDESAWSVSFDDGDIWNQLSLVDTQIDYLSDVAVSPDCNKTMLVSVNLFDTSRYCEDESTGCDSVWLHAENLPEANEYSGKWMRTWCGRLEGPDWEWGFLRLAPEETTGDTVYLVDEMTDTVYWNELETLACWEVGSATVDYIVDLAVKDKETIFALDSGGNVAMSDDYALGFHDPVDSEVGGGTIAVWGDHVLVGGVDGDVSYSDDGGETFTELDEDGVSTGGFVTVAFDSYFDQNDTVYAALAWAPDPDNGVYRWVIGESDEWKDLRAEPLESKIGVGITTGPTTGDDVVEVHFTGLVVDNADGNPMTSPENGGVIYASFVYGFDGTATGAARYLTPAEDVICGECGDWDYLIMGLTGEEYFDAIPDALKICGCLTPDSTTKLFAIDTWGSYDMDDYEDGAVWAFEDCYSKGAPDLVSPADDATIAADPCSCYSVPFTLMWDRMCDACSYNLQIALDEDFDELVFPTIHIAGDDIAAEAPAYHISGGEAGELSCETTYYWRVQAADAETGQYIRSWWSEPREFTVAPAEGAGVNLIAPEPGATDVATSSIAFSWSEVASADEYDWMLSANSDLSSPIDTEEGLTGTATAYTGTALDYETPYFWQVMAYKDGALIDTSTVGTFTTMEEAPPPPDDEEVVTPFWVWVVIAIGAVLVIVVIVLIFRTRRV